MEITLLIGITLSNIYLFCVIAYNRKKIKNLKNEIELWREESSLLKIHLDYKRSVINKLREHISKIGVFRNEKGQYQSIKEIEL